MLLRHIWPLKKGSGRVVRITLDLWQQVYPRESYRLVFVWKNRKEQIVDEQRKGQDKFRKPCRVVQRWRGRDSIDEYNRERICSFVIYACYKEKKRENRWCRGLNVNDVLILTITSNRGKASNKLVFERCVETEEKNKKKGRKKK